MSYEPRPGSLAERAIAILSENPAGLRARDLADALDVRQEQLTTRLAPPLYHGVITKIKDGQSAKYRLSEYDDAPDADFNCAVWDDGTIYMEGVSINENGMVVLKKEDVQALQDFLNRAMPRPVVQQTIDMSRILSGVRVNG